MVEKLTNDLIDQMIEKKLIKEAQREEYIYALISLVEKYITVGTIILVSICVKRFLPTIFFLVFFLQLRKRTGGFHLNSFKECYIGTVGTYIVMVVISEVLVHKLPLLVGMLLLSIGVIGVIGTVNHPAMNMNAEELAEAKKASRIMVILEGIIIYLFALLDAEKIYISYMSTAIILCAILLCTAKIIKQEVAKNEES